MSYHDDELPNEADLQAMLAADLAAFSNSATDDEMADPKLVAAAKSNDEITIWDWLSGGVKLPHAPEAILLSKQIDYFLRKWTACEIFNADVESSTTKSEPIEVVPVVLASRRLALGGGRFANDEEDEDGGSQGGGPGQITWNIIESGSALKTGRPDLFGEYAALGEYVQVVGKMVERAASKGWKNVGVVGYCPDIAWVAIEKFNAKNPEQPLLLVNFAPKENALQRYQQYIEKAISVQATFRS